mmetsp:Transcript_9099/g.33192  ORF Transcript_9099/g.33192 Transcript_9099/m.33192 type:complete len:120 (-) Transcript_9099:529-888(-)
MLSVYPSRGDRELPFVPFSRGAACSRSRAADERQLYFRAPPSRSQTSTRCVDALRERDDVCDRVMEIPLMSLFYHLSSRSSTPLALVEPLSCSCVTNDVDPPSCSPSTGRQFGTYSTTT